MKPINILALALLAGLSINCKDVKKETQKAGNEVEQTMEELQLEVEEKTLEINLEPKSDSNVKGVASFTETNGSVRMVATLSGLTPGEHAIHIHEKADCSAADGTSAGGHWNPTHSQHGKWGAAEGYHRGDIGNFTADDEGNATITFSTDEWCIGCEDPNKDLMGKSVIVHQGTDDFVSQPSGNAGKRISCAGIIE